MNLLARIALLALFAVFCQVGVAQAQVAFADPDNAQVMADPNINDTCDQSVVAQQYNALGTYLTRVTSALKFASQDNEIVRESYNFTASLGDLFFCPIKITAITNLVNVASTIAAGIMSAVLAALSALITTLITNIVNAICQAFLGAVQALVAGLCIPNISLSFRVPEFAYRGRSNTTCPGTPLITVTGGPPVAAPPLNYGASLPNSNMQNGLVTIR